MFVGKVDQRLRVGFDEPSDAMVQKSSSEVSVLLRKG